MENPRYKNLELKIPPQFEKKPETVVVNKSSAMGATELAPSFMTQEVLESNKLKKRRAKKKMARASKRKNRRKK